MTLKAGLTLCSLMLAAAQSPPPPPTPVAQGTDQQPSPQPQPPGPQPAAQAQDPGNQPQATDNQVAQGGQSAAIPAPLPAADAPLPNDTSGRLYSLTVQDQPADAVVLHLAKAAGMTVSLVSPSMQMVSLSFANLTFQEALQKVTAAADLDFRYRDGIVFVGLPMDLEMKFPNAAEQVLDAVYRCRFLNAQTLADTLTTLFPPEAIRIKVGPQWLSPNLDGSTDPSGSGAGGDVSIRALQNTDISFRIHDIVLSGPGDLVRRALMLAKRFDRPRKQVRIAVRVVELSESLDQELGLTWGGTTGSINLSAVEQTAPATANAAAAAVVDGIRLGRFAHSPLTVNATLTALEKNDKAKTLANPTLTLLDGERSFILSGQKYLYPKFREKDQSGQSVYDIETVKVGIYLQVSVQIGLNGEIIMDLQPQVTSVIRFDDYNGGRYPSITTREAETTVQANSGEMIVLGGLKLEEETNTRTGVPLLKDIPFLGRLFSSASKIRTKSELMILITPELVEDDPMRKPVDIRVHSAPVAKS